MKSAVVPAITELPGAELSDVVATASGGSTSGVRPHYLILTPFDPRLIERIAPAVAKAAMDRGVATRLPKHVARRELALARSHVSPLSRIAQITRVHHDPAGLDRHFFTVRVATAMAFRIMSAIALAQSSLRNHISPIAAETGHSWMPLRGVRVKFHC